MICLLLKQLHYWSPVIHGECVPQRRGEQFYPLFVSVVVVQLSYVWIGLAPYRTISNMTVFLLTGLQVRNSKASGYCLDQGAEEDDKAILYPCHGMSSQVNNLNPIIIEKPAT